MTAPAVSYRIWNSDALFEEKQCAPDTNNAAPVPNLPSASERASILGIDSNSEVIAQQQQISALLDAIHSAGTQANAALTQLMGLQASTTPAPNQEDDNSSGEDEGDPNESTSSPTSPTRAQLGP